MAAARIIWTLVLFAIPALVWADESFNGTPYTQNFDSLASSGSNISWANDSTIAGWYLYRIGTPPVAVPTYDASSGSGNAGSFYSFGLTSERALGGIGSGGSYFGNAGAGQTAGWMAFAIVNTSGITRNQFEVRYDGEQWRDANASAQTMTFEYGFGATFNTVATWTAPGGNFDFTSPLATNANAAVNGNTSGLLANRGGVIFQTWTAGEKLWLRWREVNNTGNDHALAIDNVRVESIPEPTGLGLALFLSLAGAARFRRRSV